MKYSIQYSIIECAVESLSWTMRMTDQFVSAGQDLSEADMDTLKVGSSGFFRPQKHQ